MQFYEQIKQSCQEVIENNEEFKWLKSYNVTLLDEEGSAMKQTKFFSEIFMKKMLDSKEIHDIILYCAEKQINSSNIDTNQIQTYQLLENQQHHQNIIKLKYQVDKQQQQYQAQVTRKIHKIKKQHSKNEKKHNQAKKYQENQDTQDIVIKLSDGEINQKCVEKKQNKLNRKQLNSNCNIIELNEPQIFQQQEEEIQISNQIQIQQVSHKPTRDEIITQKELKRNQIKQNKINLLTKQICFECQNSKQYTICIQNQDYICSECLLCKLNPFNKIIQTLGIIPFEIGIGQIESIYKFQHDNLQYPLEIRCIQANQKSLGEFTFPQNILIKLNGYNFKEIEPLKQVASIKKRKDNSLIYNLNNNKQAANENQLTLTIIERRNKPHLKQDEMGEIYVFGIYFVKKINLNVIIQEISIKNACSRSKEDYEEMNINMLKVSLRCVQTFNLIKIPVKGQYCLHKQCFCLISFLNLMAQFNHMKWNCPICKQPIINFVIDKIQEEILEKIANFNIKTDSILLDLEGKLDQSDSLFLQLQQCNQQEYKTNDTQQVKQQNDQDQVDQPTIEHPLVQKDSIPVVVVD